MSRSFIKMLVCIFSSYIRPNIYLCMCFITDSLYPFCAMSKKFCLGSPEVIIGPQVKNFVWGDNELFLQDENGSLNMVEGLLLVRVVLPRSVAPKLRGIPFLPRKFKNKSVAAECNMCLENHQRHDLCKHNDFERSFVETYTINELVYARLLGYEILEIFEVSRNLVGACESKWHFTKSTWSTVESKTCHILFSRVSSTVNQKLF